MLDVTHSQFDVKTEFVVAPLILIFLQILAPIKWFLAFYKFLETVKDC